jgi:hypothetical protein
MCHRILAWIYAPAVIAAVLLAPMPVKGQTSKAPSKSTRTWTQPKTAWGDPDIQGIWTGTDMIGTPMQRPESLKDKTVVTDEEFARREAQRKAQEEFDNAEFVGPQTRCDPKRGGLGNTPDTCKDGVSIGPPLYWQDRGKPQRQASLVVEPSDGRIPPLTPEAQKLAAARVQARRARGVADSWEDRSLWERCVTRGVLGSILPSGYNNGNQIVQTPGMVVLRNEMIHETRFIPVDGRPHAGANIRLHMGDSRGHWEGNTLVVETTNFPDQTLIANTAASEALRLVERFTRADADTVRYEVTVDDPKTWTSPWKISFPLKHEAGYQIFEYACHEGNYYMFDALSGARAEDQAKGAK